MTTKPKQRAKRRAVKRSTDRANEETSYRPFADLEARGKKAPPAVPPKAAPKSKPAPATLAKELSFALQMRDVRPLPDRGPRESFAEATTTPVRPTTIAETRFEVIDDGVTLEGRRVDVDPREVGRLRRAQYPIDGTLDLHGKTLLDAKAAVIEYVARRRRQGDRAILIVHGKGVHSSRGQAVLRGELGAWLSQGTAAKHVHAFVSRLDADERSGALAVLLAKH